MDEKLPKGWAKTLLGEIAVWGSGGTPSREISKYYEGNIPWIKSGELNDNIIFETEEHISEEALKNSSTKLFPKGSIALAMYGATIGKTAILGIDASTNQACAVARVYDGVNNKYLFYYLRSQKQDFIGKGKGGAQPNISQTVIKLHPIPLCPTVEQENISNKLDYIFGRFVILKHSLDNIPHLIKQFKQSVLNEAVIGKLTKSKFRNKTIEDIYTFIGSGITPKGGSRIYKSDGIPFIRSMNVYPEGIVWDGMAYVDQTLHKKMHRTHVQEGDVLLNITGASIGRSTIIPKGFGQANVNQHVCIIRVNDTILPEYLSYYLNSPEGQELIMSTQTGMTRQGLNYNQIKTLSIKLPSIEDQKLIINKIKSLFLIIANIEKRCIGLEQEINILPQAILTKAFTGQLFPQIKNAEPIDILLKKIRNEKNNQKATIKFISKSKIKKKSKPMELLEIIKKEFGSKYFNYEELDNRLNHGSKEEYIKTKKMFFDLLRNEKLKNKKTRIKSDIDSIKGALKFKLIE